MNIIKKQLIGTKVSYTKRNLKGQKTYAESIVVDNYHDGRFLWICLSNGDKMFQESLTIIK